MDRLVSVDLHDHDRGHEHGHDRSHEHGHEHRGSSRAALAAGLVVAALGAIVLRLAIGDEMLQYVKPSMRLPLLATGVFVLAVALIQLFRPDRRVHVPTAAAWLLVPVLLIGVIRPAPLGAGSQLEQSDAFRIRPIDTVVIPATAYLPDGADPATVTAAAVAVGLDQFLASSLDPTPMIAGAAVELFGQLARREVDGVEVWVVQRYRIMCCAADALLLFVVLDDVPAVGGTIPAEADWVEVTGRWVDDTRRPPVIAVADVSVVDAPSNPYLA
jgi:uncharacterized repeat protein (TIGR03943 family)